QQQILAKLYDADRSVRKAAAEGLTAGLQSNIRLLTYLFNTLVLDHKIDCELRHFPGPMAPRHLANEISDRMVDALLTAAERYHGSVHRYYRLRRSSSASVSSTTTTATRRCSRTYPPATGRRPDGRSRKVIRRSARAPAR